MNISSAPWQTSNYYQFLYQVQLLQRSNEVPESPGPNTLPHASTYSADRRQLSFKYEKHLAESLAFLAAFNEDPRKVIALCLEEDPGGNALRVRISSNHGSLDEFCKTFEGVSLILRKLAKRGKEDRYSIEFY